MATKASPPKVRDDEIDATPEQWRVSARTLFYSAEVIYQKYALEWENASEQRRALLSDKGFYIALSSNIILLLYGLAIENLIKGLLIAQGTKPFTGKALNKSLNTHDLEGLFTKAKLNLLPDDRRLLRLLRDVIESGKYPVGKHPVNLRKNHSYLKGKTIIKPVRQHIKNVFTKLEDELRAAMNDKIFDRVNVESLERYAWN